MFFRLLKFYKTVFVFCSLLWYVTEEEIKGQSEQSWISQMYSLRSQEASSDNQEQTEGSDEIPETEHYFFDDWILMRKWRSPEVPANEERAVVNQVVVPAIYRDTILSMAHSLPLGGHLGVKKTVH